MASDDTPAASVIVFPFDLFGNAGTAAGAELLGDAVREILADNRRESRPTRADAYHRRVKAKEFAFPTAKAVATWRQVGRQAVRQPLKSGDRVIWLAGNHLGVLPVYEELGAGGAGTLVVQFDAHLDVYQLHDQNPHPANGNFLLHSDEPLPAVVNVGHRDLFLPADEVRGKFAVAYSALDLANDPERVAADIRKRAEKAKRVWIDIDADVFDPAHMPAVHHPLPFGPSPLAVLKVIDAAFEGSVVGLSLSEFDPGRDVRDAGLNLFGWLIEWFLLRWFEG